MYRALMPVVLAVSLSVSAHAAEGDAAAGESLYQSVCKNCHGPTAKGLASYPGLVGKGADHLRERLERYRAGEKIGPNSMLMIPHAKELSDQDISDIIEYIESTLTE